MAFLSFAQYLVAVVRKKRACRLLSILVIALFALIVGRR
jgi:hypothetical protein